MDSSRSFSFTCALRSDDILPPRSTDQVAASWILSFAWGTLIHCDPFQKGRFSTLSHIPSVIPVTMCDGRIFVWKNRLTFTMLAYSC